MAATTRRPLPPPQPLMMLLPLCLALSGGVGVGKAAGFAPPPLPPPSAMRASSLLFPLSVTASPSTAGRSARCRILLGFRGGTTRGAEAEQPLSSSSMHLLPPTCLAATAFPPPPSIVTDDSNLDDEQDYIEELGPTKHYDSIVAGGGPAGLLTAIMLSRKYGPDHHIAVYERRPDPPPSPNDEEVWNDAARFYLLGLGHRGQDALKRFGVYDDFEDASVEVDGRRDWKPGMTSEEDGVETPARKDVKSRVLARDKLVGVLHHHIQREYALSKIELLYGYQVEPVGFGEDDDDVVTVRVSRCEEAIPREDRVDASSLNGSNDGPSSSYLPSSESSQLCGIDEPPTLVSTFLLVGADGSARTVANAMERHDAELSRRKKNNPLSKPFSPRPFRVRRYDDTNPRVYKSVPVRIPSHWKPNLNYSARSRGNRITLEALPCNDNGDLCALLLMRPDDDLAQSHSDLTALRKFFDEEFPCFSALIDDDAMAAVAAKGSSALPSFRYAGPRLNQGGRTVLLGDAAHTVKPYYGLGANTALEDVSVLCDALDEAAEEEAAKTSSPAATAESSSSSSPSALDVYSPTSAIPTGVRLFSSRRSKDAESLVRISRSMDRPGKVGTLLFFVLPLILDSIFHRLAPSVFDPNMFGMFQKRGMGFVQIRNKKRRDRVLQVAILGVGFAGAGLAVRKVVGAVAKAAAAGWSRAAVGLGVMAAVAAVGVKIKEREV